ncbi:MAG: hypothetical protein GY803_09500, partial [Chloroflexi bacterium]|nr:hypothetical protein [Chloroflexota bacterium]
ELTTALMVTRRGTVFVPAGAADANTLLQAQRQREYYSHTGGGKGEKRSALREKGIITDDLYGYVRTKDGSYHPDPEMANLTHELREAFLAAANGESYNQIADDLNETGTLTPTGRPWTRHSAREFLRNGVRYAGYLRLLPDGKRGKRAIMVPAQNMPAPLITLETWIRGNFYYIETTKITFDGFRDGDEAVWERRWFLSPV